MKSSSKYAVEVSVRTQYIEEQSQPDKQRFAFAYHITIRNVGELGAQLLTRHWVIRDANGKVQEVRGDGVVGEQPHLAPGQAFQYSSGTLLETSVGVMGGSYQMHADDGTRFDAPIDDFTLSVPRVLH